MEKMSEKQNQSSIFLDSLGKKEKGSIFFDLPLVQYINKHKKSSILFSKKGRTESFFTNNQELYFHVSGLKKRSYETKAKSLDSLRYHNQANFKVYKLKQRQADFVYMKIQAKYENWQGYLSDFIRGATEGLTMRRMWNVSIVGAVLFGMFSMTMIYRYLGQSVSAKIQESKEVSVIQRQQEEDGDSLAFIANESGEEINSEIDINSITSLLQSNKQESDLEKEIREMVKGFPIEKMAGEIATKNRIVAAFLVGIAKKESNWGKRVPVLNGQDCYNYWGYRGQREKMGSGGHTCFDSPKDAVDTVAKRLEFLVSNEKLNTPAKMVVWKCGYDCSWDSKVAVQKWISDVNMYFKKLN
ncbi:MAG: hypothetical protein COU40_00390 [Candidatus Moranbacteria bacterium CG10_big_fil_rev_8_21_14_0_10_35_21]|nr:MAG: hypothetical protein COU40_00390 [Candidatus Moranbacteria bacterium CG10_big_fil_rev_8_21_14_0_10_35_21]PJA88348.1 MAG: hypothetical protein CO139_03700 [Candidatus Moranbacteria bacterium CG_4_9_14_3_um_filter_36_9]